MPPAWQSKYRDQEKLAKDQNAFMNIRLTVVYSVYSTNISFYYDDRHIYKICSKPVNMNPYTRKYKQQYDERASWLVL